MITIAGGIILAFAFVIAGGICLASLFLIGAAILAPFARPMARETRSPPVVAKPPAKPKI